MPFFYFILFKSSPPLNFPLDQNTLSMKFYGDWIMLRRPPYRGINWGTITKFDPFVISNPGPIQFGTVIP